MSARISVAMATFNGAAFLKEQLQSLSAQNTLPRELWVTDDGSTDETLTILESFAAIAPFPVKVRQNDQRLGYGRNFLKAASLCTAEYVAFCDQDDVWHQNKVQVVSAVINKMSPDIVVHSGIVVDQRLQPLGDRYPDIQNNGWLDPAELHQNFFWPGYAIAMRRDTLDAWGIERAVSDDDLCRNSFAHDRWVFDAARAGATCYLLTDELVKYRQHTSNHIGFCGAVEQLPNFA